MRPARERALQQVGDEIRVALLNGAPDPRDATLPTAQLRDLKAKYRLVEEGYHTWPLGRTAFGGVSITAGLTLLGNSVTIVYRMYGGR